MGRYERITVTPEVASKLLQHNETNRTIRPTWVNKYAKDMQEGRWVRNGETITLIERSDGTKRLLNGQHRLQAVTQSGCTIDFDFYIADPSEDEDLIFTTADGGAKRSFEDVVRGRLDDFGTLADIPPRLINDAVRTIMVADIQIPEGKAEYLLPSNERKMQIAVEHLDEVEWIAEIIRDYKKAMGHHLPIGARAALLKAYRFDANLAMTFTQRLIDGALLTPGNPIHTLRAELIRGMAPGTKLSQIPYWYQMASRAWNHYVSGRTAFMLRPGKAMINPIAPPTTGTGTNGTVDTYLEEEAEEMRIAARSKR